MKDWKKILKEKRALLEDVEDYPALDALVRQWELIEGHGFIERDDLFEYGNSLSALEYFVDFGLYPPPELLLLIAEQYNSYLSGDMSLDEAFFGKARPKAGGFRNDFWKNQKYLRLHFEIVSGKRANVKMIKVAEEFVKKYQLSIDPESLLKSYREHRKECEKRRAKKNEGAKKTE